jgi:tRNA-specific 2-thiouridylase
VERRGARLALLAGSDPAKDQSYFLHGLGQAELADLVFPVGHLAKGEVRALAARAGLSTAGKAESQEICFVTDGDAGRFVELRRPGAARPGDVVSGSGQVLGRHRGVHRFTVGQRRGLGISRVERAYVVRIEPEAARVVVGSAAEASSGRFLVKETRWVGASPPAGVRSFLIRVRHRHEGEHGQVIPGAGGTAEVRLRAPVRGVAPGQAAVFYEGDEVVGGGRIARG